MKKLILLTLLTLPQYFLAQIPGFSQAYLNPIYTNPAFAGTSNSQRIDLNFMDQLPNNSYNSVTYGISYDRNIIDSNLGIGLTTQAGIARNSVMPTNASFMVSYQFHLKSFTLSAGLQGTLGHDFSAGVLAYGKNYFVGIAVNPITRPAEFFVQGDAYALLPNITVNGGLSIYTSAVTISPTLLYLNEQGFNEVMLQCYMSYKKFVGGIGGMFNAFGYNFDQQNDALTILLGYQNKSFRMGYSYDYYTSYNISDGAHELSLAFFLAYKSDKLKKTSGLNCPML